MLLFGGLYFAQGVPWGFLTVAVVLRLTKLGLSPAAIGDLMFVATLPWTGKPLIGLLVDRVPFGPRGRRRLLILSAEASMALTLLALAFTNPLEDWWLFLALLFLHNLLAASQDVATDALAIDLLEESERSRANGIMSASKFFGVLVGGQGLLWVADVAGWPVAYGVAIALLLVPARLVMGIHEKPLPIQRPRLFGLALRTFSSRIVLLASAFALVVHLAEGLTFPLTYPLFCNQLGYSEQQVAWLATLNGTVSALGSLLGGALGDRLGCRRMLLYGCLGMGGCYLVFALCKGFWVHGWMLISFTIVGGLMSGVVYATMLALFMGLTNPRFGATQFQVYQALINANLSWSQAVGGRLAGRLSAPAMFGLGALAEVLPLLLLPWLDARKAQEEFTLQAKSAAQPAGEDRS
jgi:PAT family beta-lactamase induction signal transducer AmpG